MHLHVVGTEWKVIFKLWWEGLFWMTLLFLVFIVLISPFEVYFFSPFQMQLDSDSPRKFANSKNTQDLYAEQSLCKCNWPLNNRDLNCWLAICMSSLKKYLFKSLAQFLIMSFILLELSCRCCSYVFEISCLLVASFAIIFSHSEGCLFTLLV